MSRIKSNTLPHSLYSKLKREIARRNNRIAELERALELAHELKAQNVVSLTAALEAARDERDSLTAKVEALLSINNMRIDRIIRQNDEIDSLRKRAASKSKALRNWRTIGIVGIALAIATAVVELVGWAV